jgi:cytoskeleton protein RodZ
MSNKSKNDKSEAKPTRPINDSMSIGEYLKDLRERSGLNLETIAHRTKINLTILKILEEDRLEDLPNITYVKGFVKAVCKEIGGDVDASLEVLSSSYKDESPEPTPLTESGRGNEEKTVGTFANIPTNYWKLASVVAGIAIFAFLIIPSKKTGPVLSEEQTKELKEEIAKIETQKPAVIVEKAIVEEPKKEIIAKEEISKPLQAVVEKKPVADPEIIKIEEKAPEPKKIIEEPKKVVAESKPDPAVEITPDNTEVSKVIIDSGNLEDSDAIDYTKLKLDREYTFSRFTAPLYQISHKSPDNINENLLPTQVRKSTVNGKENLYVNAVTGDTWVSYKIDDAPVKAYVLNKGKSLLLRGNLILIKFGNINVTKLFLNNKLITVKSRTGVRSLVVPQSYASKYVAPLFVRDQWGRRISSQAYLKAQADQVLAE